MDEAEIQAKLSLLAMASAFDVLPYDSRRRLRMVRVERRSSSTDEAPVWAITDGGGCTLARDGEWEFECQPSSRTDEYFARCRWNDLQEAIAFVSDHLARYPDGYKPEHGQSEPGMPETAPAEACPYPA